MKKHIFLYLIILLLVLFIIKCNNPDNSVVTLYYNLKLLLLDTNTKAPIPYASVAIGSKSYQWRVTGINGEIQFDSIPKTSYNINISSSFYSKNLNIYLNGDRYDTILIKPYPSPYDTVAPVILYDDIDTICRFLFSEKMNPQTVENAIYVSWQNSTNHNFITYWKNTNTLFFYNNEKYTKPSSIIIHTTATDFNGNNLKNEFHYP